MGRKTKVCIIHMSSSVTMHNLYNLLTIYPFLNLSSASFVIVPRYGEKAEEYLRITMDCKESK